MPTANVRPDPDALLKQANAEETRRKRGRLSIFLGYAAGVGKTYAMLEAAHQRRQDGVDVVLGYVETHRRPETDALRQGLEEIPVRKLEYKGVWLSEMDLDAVLSRQPQWAVVDELAHTNAPGSRHPKRYQDVEELLANGIHVMTTLNVQHVESLNDVVAQITGILVKETVPDRLLKDADEIHLVDLPSEELQQRLREGKVYVAGQAESALKKFFRLGNLNALRELALRITAERVGEQMRSYMESHAISGPWHADERILVCLAATPSAEKLVRSARRLADKLHGDLLAIHVESPSQHGLDEMSVENLHSGLQLASQLGAETTVLPGDSIAESVLRFAARHNITKIVLGKTQRPAWKERLQGSLVDHLIRHSGNIDIYIVSDVPESEGARLAEPRRASPAQPWNGYGWAGLLVAAATAMGLPLRQQVEPTNLVMLYLLAILFVALRWGRGPSLLASILGVLAFDFFMVAPYHTFAVSDVQYFFTFAVMLLVGSLTSGLAARAREQAEAAQRRTLLTTELYNFTKDLATATRIDEVLVHIVDTVEHTLSGKVAVFLSKGEKLVPQAGGSFQPGQEELAVAHWAYQHNQPAGQGTETLAGARGRYLPLRTAKNTIGTLGILLTDSSNWLGNDRERLLDAFSTQAALAIEHLGLQEQAMQVKLLTETERLQTALLNSISHDLRTPLVSITGALTAFKEQRDMHPAARGELLQTALDEASRLNRLVGNLLDMTRLEGGVIKPLREAVDLREIIEVVIEEYRGRLVSRPLKVDLPDTLPFVFIDPVLVGRALGNTVDNALKYSPPGSELKISAVPTAESIRLVLEDSGPGIPSDELDQVFDKFHRVDRKDQLGGSGLGLSISKGLIEANGGHIQLANRPTGGLRVEIDLPQAEA
ncbi:MAG: sensor histidine kinase KdpD [Anaerolineales bacterium]|nr:sensor histidine kinase KdpD [Anaerolineales bacterium]MCW5838527.1 sensor histidine kinase KdpD [Anaerolineales bacterium]